MNSEFVPWCAMLTSHTNTCKYIWDETVLCIKREWTYQITVRQCFITLMFTKKPTPPTFRHKVQTSKFWPFRPLGCCYMQANSVFQLYISDLIWNAYMLQLIHNSNQTIPFGFSVFMVLIKYVLHIKVHSGWKPCQSLIFKGRENSSGKGVLTLQVPAGGGHRVEEDTWDLSS